MDVLVDRVLIVGKFRLDTEGVGPEVVTLSLQQVRRKILGSVSIVEAQSSAESRGGDTPKGTLADDVSPSVLSLVDGLVEEIIEQQVLEIGVVSVCMCDIFQENGSNDAATTPHESNGRLVELPLVLFGSLKWAGQTD
jgi:hypothetical protein